MDKLTKKIKQWQIGNPKYEKVSLGPMIEQAHFDKVTRHIAIAKVEGASLITGGNSVNIGSGWYVEPTIFDGVKPEMTLFQQEVFGPVLAVSGFETEDEAIALANNSNYGLAASFYTQNISRALKVASAIKAGTVSINGFSEGDITTPFGGYKQSGFGGRDNGLEALEQYCQTKTVWVVR